VPSDCKEQSKEVGDRAGKGTAYGNLGIAYQSYVDFSKAIKHHTQRLAIAKEVGDRAGEGRAYRNLGTCHMHLNEYLKETCFVFMFVVKTLLSAR